MVLQLRYVNIYSSELSRLSLATLALTTAPRTTRSRLVVGRPWSETVVGVEVHGVVLLLPDDLLHGNSRLVGGEDGSVEGQTPVYAQSDKTNRNQC